MEPQEGNGTSELRAPYATWDTFGPVLERIRRRSPTSLDVQILQGWNLSESSALKVLPALRFFGIIDSKGKPTPVWERIAVQDQEKYRVALQTILREAYKKLLEAYPGAFDESDDRLADMIGEVYKSSPSSRGAAVTLLKRLLSEAGLRQSVESREPRIKSAGQQRRPKSRPALDKVITPKVESLPLKTTERVAIHVHVNVAADITETELHDFLQRVTRAASNN